MAQIRSIAVIGAGALGRGIAELSVLGGYHTILEDILPASLRSAEAEIRGNIEQAIEQGRVTALEAHAALLRLEYASTVEQAARGADLVIESVPDELESKLEILTLLDKTAKPATIFAVNSMALSVTELASVTYRAAKILGMRFRNPAHTVPFIELVRAADTDEETMAACTEVIRRIGKQISLVQESANSSIGSGETALPT